MPEEPAGKPCSPEKGTTRPSAPATKLAGSHSAMSSLRTRRSPSVHLVLETLSRTKGREPCLAGCFGAGRSGSPIGTRTAAAA
jgi:hypothetical protein